MLASVALAKRRCALHCTRGPYLEAPCPRLLSTSRSICTEIACRFPAVGARLSQVDVLEAIREGRRPA
jgi:hypothetical protein